MDINITSKRTRAYFLSVGLLAGFFVVLALALTILISTFTELDSYATSALVAIATVLLFSPLRNRVQLLVDKLFYKKTYDYYATIQKVSQDLASMLDFKMICSFVGEIIFSTLGLKNIYLLSVVPSGDYEIVYQTSYDEEMVRDKKDREGTEERQKESEEALKIAGDSELVQHLITHGGIVIRDELPGRRPDATDNMVNTLRLFHGEAVMPVFIDSRLELFLILGGKLSGDIFSHADISLLDTVSHQTAISVKNAWLYAEKFRSESLVSIGLMSATFAHEIRNPLTSIKTFAQLIPEKYSDPEFKDTFSKIVIDEIEKIDGLIKDLLSFSSREASNNMKSIDIIAIIDETLEQLKGEFQQEKRKINVEKLYKNVKINITGDTIKLRQAFINILRNGFQAMEESGVLRVSIGQNGRGVKISIADTGKGISPKDIEKIFDPFYTSKLAGMGLGLAISKKIIEDHGGMVAVESKLSKGTTFTVSLPLQKQTI